MIVKEIKDKLFNLPDDWEVQILGFYPDDSYEAEAMQIAKVVESSDTKTHTVFIIPKGLPESSYKRYHNKIITDSKGNNILTQKLIEL